MYSRPMFDKEAQFNKSYQHFSRFLLVLLDCEYAGKTRQEALSDWLKADAIVYDSRREIIAEGRRFMQQIELPWTLIEDTTNHLFGSQEAAYAWLTDALNQIEATLRS